MRRTAPPTRRNRCLAGWMTPLLLAGAARGETAPNSPPPPPWPPVCEAIGSPQQLEGAAWSTWCYDLTSMRGGGSRPAIAGTRCQATETRVSADTNNNRTAGSCPKVAMM